MKTISIIIEWYGPYSLEEAKAAASEYYDDGLYMVIGKTPYERSRNLQYVGIAKNLERRLNGYHHKIPSVIRNGTGEKSVWMGEVMSPRTPGRKLKVTDRLLDLAEWAHVYFLQLPLNEKKKCKPPDNPVVIYNRWYRCDFVTPYLRRPHKNWPDLIDYAGPEYNAKLVWFGGKQVNLPPANFI